MEGFTLPRGDRLEPGDPVYVLANFIEAVDENRVRVKVAIGGSEMIAVVPCDGVKPVISREGDPR